MEPTCRPIYPSHTAAAPSCAIQNSARVFVGNIPRLATEHELASELSVFGPVVSFKLILDKNTGHHKGYGFCEFRDHETALSAVRNQKGLLSQGRQLRVALAHSAQERRKSAAASPSPAAHKSIQPPAAPLKEQKNEARELDVFALRQLMKLRQAMATQKSSPPLKRGCPSEGSSTSLDTANLPLKKLALIDHIKTKEVNNSRAGRCDAAIPAASHEVLPTGRKTADPPNYLHVTAQPTGSGNNIKAELDDLAVTTATKLPEHDNMQRNMHADLIMLFRLLSGSDAAPNSTSHHHIQCTNEPQGGTAPLPNIHADSSNFRVAFAAN